MKIITFNVNGIRACIQKGLLDFIASEDADLVCIQETKAQPDQVQLDLPSYEQFWSSAEKKGYSGTLILSKKSPISSDFGGLDNEGRTVCLEFSEFYIVNNYVPNAQNELARIDYRLDWEERRLKYLKDLDSKKPVIMCGDLNVAHSEIDLKNPKTNRNNAGFTDEERAKLSAVLDSGFTDTFRFFYPDKEGIYSWWSYRFKAREKNAGWRIDYFITSKRLDSKLKSAGIHTDIFGSDHCPIELEADL